MLGETHALLRALLAAVEHQTDPAVLLHEEVALCRLDGTWVYGRDAVREAVCAPSTERRLTARANVGDALEVAMEITGVGVFVFHLQAVTHEGTLREIRMEIPTR